MGKACRKQTPRATHAQWQPPAKRVDPVILMEQSSQNRIKNLVPIRYGRMLSSPFTFLRGSPIVMGARPGVNTRHRAACAVMRRRPPGQFRRLRQPRTQSAF